jgi:SAM-dependent methyltransferase
VSAEEHGKPSFQIGVPVSPSFLSRRRLLEALSLLISLGLTGCSTEMGPHPRDNSLETSNTSVQEAAPTRAEDLSPLQAKGLPVGINDNFLSEDLDVEKYVDRFEGESRDVYAARHAIVESLQLSPGDSIADIGAGTGFFSFLFADEVAASGSVYAVEISPRFLEHLRTRAGNEAPDTVRVIEGTARSVALPNASIDLAFICDVYHHFEYPADSLASLHSAVRPGGSLVLIDFERVPGQSPEWLLDHVRAGREVFQAEIEAAGFELVQDIELEGLDDNYILRFDRVE